MQIVIKNLKMNHLKDIRLRDPHRTKNLHGTISIMQIMIMNSMIMERIQFLVLFAAKKTIVFQSVGIINFIANESQQTQQALTR